MTTGYLRVGTGKQHPANQQDEIWRFAASRHWTIDGCMTEVASGRKHERDRKPGALLRRMKRGDTLIVTEISRLSRPPTDVMAIMGKYLKKEINLCTTKEGYTFDKFRRSHPSVQQAVDDKERCRTGRIRNPNG